MKLKQEDSSVRVRPFKVINVHGTVFLLRISRYPPCLPKVLIYQFFWSLTNERDLHIINIVNYMEA